MTEEAIGCVEGVSQYAMHGVPVLVGDTRVSDLPMAIGLTKDHAVTSI